MTRQVHQQPLDFMLPEDARQRKRIKTEIRAHWFRMIESIEQLDGQLTRGKRRRVIGFVKRWLHSPHPDWRGIGTVRQTWLAKEWAISRQTLANYLEWAKSLGAVDWSIDTDASGIRRTTIEFTYGVLAARLGCPKLPDQSQTVDDQSQTVDDQSQTVWQHSLSCSSSCSTSTTLEWQAAAEALQSCGVTFADAFVIEAQQLGKSAAAVIEACHVYRVNKSKLESPGSLFVWLRRGDWPAEGIRNAEESRRVSSLSQQQLASQQREMQRTRRFKEMQREGLPIEKIEAALALEGIS